MEKDSERYGYEYKNDDLQIARLIVLAVCMLLDFIIIAGIIACFTAKRYLDLIIYAILMIFSISMKIISGFFTYKIRINYDCGLLVLRKIYPIKSILLYKGKSSDIKVEKIQADINELNDKKSIRLCSKTCVENLYMIELNEKKYVIRIDDYMYSLIEVNSDIS